MQKFKIRKNQISKNANRRKQNLENFHHNFFRKIDLEIVSRKILVLPSGRQWPGWIAS